MGEFYHPRKSKSWNEAAAYVHRGFHDQGLAMSAVIPESAEEPIPATSQDSCLCCGTTGKILYSHVRDHLFQSPGERNLRQCQAPNCGLIWLDPMPHPDELHRFYKTYYTHAPKSDGVPKVKRPKSERHLKVESQRGYLATRFGYHLKECSWWTRFLGGTTWLTPVSRMHLDFSVMHLAAVPNGRVLDVGCGGGQILANLQRFGWNVEGVDFDPLAVAAARERGVTVRLGSLADQHYSEESFDAVIMSHLIEHVPDPVSLIRECHRILKPGGRLVMVTPNTQSLSHRLFGRAWRGLEPPRHLYIHSGSSLAAVSRDGGFDDVRLATSARYAEGMFRQAFELRRLQSGETSKPFPGQKWLCRLLEVLEIGLLTFGARTIGEELVCVATKCDHTSSVPVLREERRVA